MKKAIYKLYALMLILLPLSSCGTVGEPAETKDVEPIATYSVSQEGFKNIVFLAQNLEERTPKVEVIPAQEAIEEKKQEEVVKKEASGKKRYFELTAYTAGVESTGKTKGSKGYGITYSGTTVQEGRTASCPKSLKVGTRLYIPSLNTTYVCEDRGSAITEGKLDIYIESLSRANDFGRKKNVEVIILPDPI